MNEPKIKDLLKKRVVDAILHDKEQVLEDFRYNQRNKLEQASSDDLDNRHIDSKNEETLFEMDLLNTNVEILEKEILQLQNIPLDAEMTRVQFGSLVETDRNVVLVAAAHEAIEIDGIEIIGISTAAPLFKKINGLKPSEKFELNGISNSIKFVK